MRHALAIALAGWMISVPSAQAVETAEPALSDELLQLWNTDWSSTEYTLDPNAPAVANDDDALQDGEWYEVDTAMTPDQAPSMTPHLDRLLQRPSADSRDAGDGAMSPFFPATGNSYSKSGSGTATHQNRRWCQHPCSHRPTCLPMTQGGSNPPKPPKPPKDDDCDPPTPTPEPASLLLFGAAAATAAGVKARRKKKNAGRP